MTANLFTRTFLFSLLPALLITGSGCTTTITRQKAPVFATTTDSLGARLNQLVSCQHFKVEGREVTTNGKKQTELEVDVINGKDIPEGDSMVTLAKKVGSEVKKALRDTGEYEQYKILFMTVKETKGLTERSWKGKVFQSAEL